MSLPSAASTLGLQESLSEFGRRPLEERDPFLILDACFERVGKGGVIRSWAVLVAIGIKADGLRHIVAVELATRESQ